jgi:hypothetical protein
MSNRFVAWAVTAALLGITSVVAVPQRRPAQSTAALTVVIYTGEVAATISRRVCSQ